MNKVINKIELMLCNAAKRPGANSCTTFRDQVAEFRRETGPDFSYNPNKVCLSGYVGQCKWAKDARNVLDSDDVECAGKCL